MKPSQAPQTPPVQTPAPTGQPANQAPAPSQTPAGTQPADQPGAAPSNQGADQGQAPAGTENGGFVFRAEAREVTLHATVVDDRNHLVNNLDKTDFTVFENDKPQKITHFHPGEGQQS
ncbi:MAG: hypothetical protein DMG92_11985 [Acidobacteria bacterium]|nr:MAG: hypothetical protein DMG92_11985 [Acidobacteriota bacterium]